MVMAIFAFSNLIEVTQLVVFVFQCGSVLLSTVCKEKRFIEVNFNDNDWHTEHPEVWWSQVNAVVFLPQFDVVLLRWFVTGLQIDDRVSLVAGFHIILFFL